MYILLTLYLWSFGCTAMAVSPNIVSTRVVATISFSSAIYKNIKYMINTILCSISNFHIGKLEMKNQPKILTYFNKEISDGWIKILIWEFYYNNKKNYLNLPQGKQNAPILQTLFYFHNLGQVAVFFQVIPFCQPKIWEFCQLIMGVLFKINNIALIPFVAITLFISTLCHNSFMFPYTLQILLLDLYEVNSI